MSFTIKAKYLVPGSNTCIMISWIYDENGFENDLMQDFFVLFFQIFIERNEILAAKAKCLVFIFHFFTLCKFNWMCVHSNQWKQFRISWFHNNY